MNEGKRRETGPTAIAEPTRPIVGAALGVLAVLILMARTAAAAPPPPAAQAENGDGGETRRAPARLSYTFGQVSFWRPGAEDWAPAEINTPLAPGDALYTGADGNLEVQIGAQAYVRAAPETELGLSNRELGYDQLEVRSGRASLDVRSLARGQVIELDTPQAAFTIEQAGYYRVEVDDGTTTFVSRRGGRARFTTATGAASSIAASAQVVIGNGEDARVATYPAPDLDAWDRWNYERTDRLVASTSARYVSADVYGREALDRYGSWRVEAEYGPVWFPAGVAATWAPYSDGRWIWDPYYGWTWVDAAPWGWAPCHYGRWVRVRGYWGWAPGPVVVTPAYAPAVVAFFGGDNFSVAVGLGAPAYGWVALGWGEPLLPWWGGVGFVGVPWWGGWGGPWIVNNVVIHHHHHRHHHHHKKFVHGHQIHKYRHARERHALQFDRGDRFGRGRHRPGRWRDVPADRLEPVRGRLQARPVAASLTPGEGRGIRPPQRAGQRPVVATRPAFDSRGRLREAGLQVSDRPRSRQRVVGSQPRERAGVERGGANEPRRPAVASRSHEGSPSRPSVPDRAERHRPPPSSPRAVERGGGRLGAERTRDLRPRPPAPRAERPSAGERRPAPAPRLQRPAVEPRSASRVRPSAPRAERPARERPSASDLRPTRPRSDRAYAPRVPSAPRSEPSSRAARPDAAPQRADRSRTFTAPQRGRDAGSVPSARSGGSARHFSAPATSGFRGGGGGGSRSSHGGTSSSARGGASGRGGPSGARAGR